MINSLCMVQAWRIGYGSWGNHVDGSYMAISSGEQHAFFISMLSSFVLLKSHMTYNPWLYICIRDGQILLYLERDFEATFGQDSRFHPSGTNQTSGSNTIVGLDGGLQEAHTSTNCLLSTDQVEFSYSDSLAEGVTVDISPRGYSAATYLWIRLWKKSVTIQTRPSFWLILLIWVEAL